jgi:hypothetical protein
MAHVKAGAEHFMAADYFAEGLLKGWDVESAGQPHRTGHVVEGAIGLQLAEKPEPLLSE